MHQALETGVLREFRRFAETAVDCIISLLKFCPDGIKWFRINRFAATFLRFDIIA